MLETHATVFEYQRISDKYRDLNILKSIGYDKDHVENFVIFI